MVVKKVKRAVEIYSHLPRYRRIVSVFFKYGFADILKLVHLQKLLDLGKAHLPEEERGLHSKPTPERFRMALEELGPTFVKFGQILSTRRDLVNEEFYEELRKLQDQVTPFPGSEAVRLVEEELNASIHKVFKTFDKTPVASASLAQVHRGVLKGGDVVAVKVQRPGIQKIIEVDLAILADLARFLDRHVAEMSVLNPRGVVREFAKTIHDELDFTNEAQNMERFAKQFHGNRAIHVPAVYHELTTDRILIMEFVSGCRVDQPDELRTHHIDPIKLSEKMSKLIFQQMFQFGFFHGDPHPGNIAVLPGGITVLYDYGMMGVLSLDFREYVAAMIHGLAQKDARLVMRSLVGMSEKGYAENEKKMTADVEGFARHYLDRPLKDLHLGFVLNRLLDLLMEHKMRMKADFYLGIKALTQAENSGRILNPDLNFTRFGEPYAVEVMENRFAPERLWKDFTKSFFEIFNMAREFPADFRNLYTKIKDGRYIIPIEHRINPEGYEPLRKTLNHMANRLVHALLASSLLICSGLLFLSGLPPTWNGMPVLGLIGFFIGSFMALKLIFSIWRRGGL